MTWAVFLVGLVGPLAARWLTVMGLQLVVLGGYAAAISQLKTLVITNAGSLPSAGVQLAGLFGIWQCFGLIFGTLTFIVTWQTTKGFWTLAKK